MNLKQTKIVVVLAAWTVITSCSSPEKNRRPADANDKTVHIVSTTDLHGYLNANTNKNGILDGGVDYAAGYFNIAKHQDPQTLFLDSGDLFQGTIVSNDFEGSPVIKFYNYVGYSSAAIGNHDFDYGPVGPDTVALKSGEDPLGALKAREKQAKFPFLSANICSVSNDPSKCTDMAHYTSASVATPYIMKVVNGVKVGIIGVTTTTTPETTMASNVSDLHFIAGETALERFVPEMKAKGAQMIVVTAHIGGYCTAGVCSPTDELFSMIDKLTPATRSNISIILAGHTHNYASTVYNGVHVIVTGCYGQAFGYETLTLHSDQSVTVDSMKTENICQKVYPDTQSCFSGTGALIAPTFLNETVVPDTNAPKLIAKEEKQANLEEQTVVGKILSPLTNTGAVSLMGEFMADAMRFCYVDSTCATHGDVAIQNNGGIRAALTTVGPINFGQVFLVEPFDNMVATIQVRGDELHGILDAISAQGGVPQISGITLGYKLNSGASRTFTNDEGDTQKFADPITYIKNLDGSDFDETKTYTVILADFLATGGGTEFFTTHLKTPPSINYSRKVRDTMVDYFKSKPAGMDYSAEPPRLINTP
jgi:5'-nucleotidase